MCPCLPRSNPLLDPFRTNAGSVECGKAAFEFLGLLHGILQISQTCTSPSLNMLRLSASIHHYQRHRCSCFWVCFICCLIRSFNESEKATTFDPRGNHMSIGKEPLVSKEWQIALSLLSAMPAARLRSDEISFLGTLGPCGCRDVTGTVHSSAPKVKACLRPAASITLAIPNIMK